MQGTYQIKCRYYGDAVSKRTVLKLGQDIRHYFKVGTRVILHDRGARLYFKFVEDQNSTDGYAIGVKYDIQVGGDNAQMLRKYEGEYDLQFDTTRGQYYIDLQHVRPISYTGIPVHGRSIKMPPIKNSMPKGGQKDISENNEIEVEPESRSKTSEVQNINLTEPKISNSNTKTVVLNQLDMAALHYLKSDQLEYASVLARASTVYEQYANFKENKN